jgi:hypothetical protein
MSDFFVVALVWVCMRKGGKLGVFLRTVKGLKRRGGRSISFVRRIDEEWGFESSRLDRSDQLIAFRSIEICWRGEKVTGL